MIWLHWLCHATVVLAVGPVLLGVISRTKARFAGRTGAPLWQPYLDLFRLFRKGTVTSTTTSWVFRAGPVAGLATALLASLVVPLGGPAPVAFAGDLVLFAYLLGLGRFFTVTAALDTGSAFEGMGAAREASFAAFAEPCLFLALMVLARTSSSFSLSSMVMGARWTAWTAASGPAALVVGSLFIVLLAENSRIPFDDPNTHLELTMIHEVMVLDHSGPPLGMVLYGASVKLLLLSALVVRAALPLTGHLWTDWAKVLAGILATAVGVGAVESVMARLRLLHVPRLLIAATLMSAFGIILAR